MTSASTSSNLFDERIVRRRRASREAGAADELEIGRAQVADEAHRVIRHRRVAPIGDGRLGEGLIRVRRGGLVLGAAHDDAGVRFPDHVQQHVGILLLRRLRAVALGIGVRRHVKRIVLQHLVDMAADVDGELRIDFVEDVLAVEQRPHFADCLIAHPGDDAADVVRAPCRLRGACPTSPAGCAAACSRWRSTRPPPDS